MKTPFVALLCSGLALLFCSTPVLSKPQVAQAHTVLLHGLARSSSSMQKLAQYLEQHGHAVCNIDYPSRHHPIEELAHQHVLPAIQACFDKPPEQLNFVTHSLGSIILRQLRQDGALPQIGRAVMLGPPNGGSEVVDKLAGLAPFQWLNGPAGSQLGTAAASVPNQLGPVDFPLGIIAGDFSINLILSLLIPGDDDGKVSLKNTRVAGMQEHIVVPVSHPFLMKNTQVMQQALHFLDQGYFEKSSKH